MCYLFSHFQYRDGEPELEQIQFSISRNGLDWILLNGGKPVIENHGDDGGLRDPFLFRKSDGSFVMLATDLCIVRRNNNWRDAIENGSRNILIWDSEDLVHWKNKRALEKAIAVLAAAEFEMSCEKSARVLKLFDDFFVCHSHSVSSCYLKVSEDVGSIQRWKSTFRSPSFNVIIVLRRVSRRA